MTRWQLGFDWLVLRIQSIVQTQRWHWLILLLWTLPLLLVGFFDLDHQSLMAHDEGLYARRARVIVDTGDWIHPWAAPHHKTPGPYWVVALFIQIFGRHEVAVRLPSVLASIGCVWLTYAIGRRLLGATAALWGALSLGVMPLWLQYSRLATPDVLFTGLILLAIWLLLASDSTDQRSSRSHWLRFSAGIILGLTVLIRSALAVIPLACLLPYFLLSGRHHLQRWQLYLGGVLGLSPTVIWLWLCWRRYDMAMIHSLLNFPVRQGLTTDRVKAPSFYLVNLLANDFLWIFFALAAVGLLVWRFVHSMDKLIYLGQPQRSLLLLYPLLYLGVLSCASTKLPHYAIPVYPFLALLTGYAMEQMVCMGPSLSMRRLLAGVNGVLLVLGAGLFLAGVLVKTTEVLPSTDTIRPYGAIAGSLGLAWVTASIIWFKHRSRQIQLWLVLLLLGHWMSLTLAWGTANLGNINPELKTLLLSPQVRPLLQTEVISFSPGISSKLKTLLRFYTPNHGHYLSNLEQVTPTDYLWITKNELNNLPYDYEIINQGQGVSLIQIKSNSREG